MNPRKPSHDPDARGKTSARSTETPPAGETPADVVHESPAANRWEDEGGPPGGEPAGGSPGAAPTAPEAPADDFRDRWLRAEAELQNFRRRATREWEEGRRSAEESVLLEMVAALDDLERALESARDAGADAGWTRGVALVAQRLREYLARQGVAVIDPAGQPFDPTFQEALLETDAPAGTPPGTVMQVVQKGYRRGDRALRAARVVVSRSPAGSSG